MDREMYINTSLGRIVERREAMKKVIMYKGYNPDRLYGGYYFWAEKEVWNDWDGIYSYPYYVEIPDDFNLCETVYGDMKYFKDGCNICYELDIDGRYCEDSAPVLIGGSSVEIVKLNVLGVVPENER